MAMMPAAGVSAPIQVNGETISTPPATMPTIPVKSAQPRGGASGAEAAVAVAVAVAVTMVPRSSQLKPIHRASSRVDCWVPRKQISPSAASRSLTRQTAGSGPAR
ncbi:hypothetical protein [Streptomyces flavofungini]|uniref:hypothetical protein n=1 Tax=Streptomyces flavofungini TaxID=68200 RepID=UPI0025AF3DB7|nr:hypothetical protein [Streptomyces flavofungini]WJV50550.1 hypothetical protein QUY26_36635 [Streptomyces flavofungini]